MIVHRASYKTFSALRNQTFLQLRGQLRQGRFPELVLESHKQITVLIFLLSMHSDTAPF